MASTMIQVPANLKPLGDAFAEYLSAVQTRIASGATALGSGGFAEVQDELAQCVARLEREGHAALLASYDVDAEAVRIDGSEYKRVGRYPGVYYTMAGEVTVERSLYRKVGERNGQTVDAVSLRSGAQDGWLPRTMEATGFLLAQGTSREAERTAATLQRLPYSRCSFERTGHSFGGQCLAKIEEIHRALAEQIVVPRAARCVSVAIDRTSIPMEEVHEWRPDKVRRAFRMAYCGTVSLHGRDGKALVTWRYGEMPHGSAHAMLARMREDLKQILSQRPRMRLAQLADGAEEMWHLMQLGFAFHHFPLWRGDTITMVDFWHLIEKLALADAVICKHQGVTPRTHADRWKLSLLNSDTALERICRELKTSGCVDKRVENTKPVRDVLRYIKNHRSRMHYVGARAVGLPIGSGNVEATCKSLVGIRMKRPGSRWKPDTAQEVLQLRTHVLSDRWGAMARVVLATKTPEISAVA